MKMFRMQWTALVAVITCVLVAVTNPEQGLNILQKVNLVVLAGWIGYWLDRELFPYARPHEADTDGAMLRRSIIVAGSMLAVGLGL